MKWDNKIYKFVSTKDYKGKVGRLLEKKSDSSYNVDYMTPSKLYSGSTELEQRILAKSCESCGEKQNILHVHHIKRVKDIKDKKNKNWLDWINITRLRRTVVLCKECHLKYHHGNFQKG